MESLLLENLRDNQAFDEVVRRGTYIDRVAADFLREVMFNPDTDSRTEAIQDLAAKAVEHFEKTLATEARKTGFSNASKVVDALRREGVRVSLDDAKLRQRVFVDLNARTEDRLRIVQHLVNDNANTLENRLTAYWLEPGLKDDAKLERLRKMHEDMEKSRATYEKRLADFAAGETDSRPRKPNLDFLSKFNESVKEDFRVQSRRVATDAETAKFQSVGVKQFAWVTVNASQACPQCQERQGRILTAEEWEKVGKPGAGTTYCGSSCFCMLVPQEAMTVLPSLSKSGLQATSD